MVTAAAIGVSGLGGVRCNAVAAGRISPHCNIKTVLQLPATIMLLDGWLGQFAQHAAANHTT